MIALFYFDNFFFQIKIILMSDNNLKGEVIHVWYH